MELVVLFILFNIKFVLIVFNDEYNELFIYLIICIC